MVKYLLIALIVSQLTAIASAQISDQSISNFNSAISSRDARAIKTAAEKLISEAIKNPDDPRAIDSAFQAAFRLTLMNDLDAASKGAEFASLADKNTTTQAHLLNALIGFSRSPKSKNRQELDAAIKTVAGSAPNALTLKSITTLQDYYQEKKEWGKLNRLTEQTIGHLEPLRDISPEHYYDARFMKAYSEFMDRRNYTAQSDMAELWFELIQLADRTKPSGKFSTELENLLWNSKAWTYAIGAHTKSTKQSADNDHVSYDRSLTDTQLDNIAAKFPLSDGTTIAWKDTRLPSSKLNDTCTGDLNYSPKIRYPEISVWRGIVGATLLKLRFDDNGRVRDPVILTSVPSSKVDKNILKSVKKWKWVSATAEDGAPLDCDFTNFEKELIVTYHIK